MKPTQPKTGRSDVFEAQSHSLTRQIVLTIGFTSRKGSTHRCCFILLRGSMTRFQSISF